MYGVKKKSNFTGICRNIILIILIWFASANATNNSQTGVSTKALSLGNAVTAYPPGIMSIHYNPAGLSKLKGEGTTFGITYPVTKIRSSFSDDPEYLYSNEHDPISGTNSASDTGAMYLPCYGPISELILMNAGVYKHIPDSKFSFAFGIYSPYSTGFSYDSDESTRFGGIMAYNQRFIYASPAISYKVNDTFSVGLSIGLGQGAEGFEMIFRSPDPVYTNLSGLLDMIDYFYDFIENPTLDFQNFADRLMDFFLTSYDPLCDINMDELKDNLTTSFNIGMLWEPVHWFSAGICYQSKSEGKLTGDYHINYTEILDRSPASELLGLMDGFHGTESGKVSVKWTWPQSTQFGIMLRPFKKLRFMCDLRWENWSAIKREAFKFDQDLQLLQMATLLGYQEGTDKLVFKRDWKDTWNLSYGLEYEIHNSFILRFGYEDRKSYMPDEYFDQLWPVEDCKIYSCGAGIGLSDKIDIDLGFSFIDGEGIKKKSRTDFIYNPYVGLDYKQDTDSYIFSMNINYKW